MAIQKINLGTEPLGEGGDTYRSANTKINENFSNTTHAASRLVGAETGNVVEITANGIGGSGIGAQRVASVLPEDGDLGRFAGRTGIYRQTGAKGAWIDPVGWANYFIIRDNANVTSPESSTERYSSILGFPRDSNNIHIGGHNGNGALRAWSKIWHSTNTKLDTNGSLSPSSPTIDLYSDRIETNEDGAKMDPEFVRNGVGDYTIKNTTGLRDNDGWFIKIPNDMNGNPKVAVAINTDKNGDLHIKTYKRTFSMETFTFGPDLNEPLDIPEGRWIDLRFNELPEGNEEYYTPETEGK